MSVPKRIDKMYAFVSVDPKDGTEGVIGVPAPWGGAMPLVGADFDRVESIRPLAQKIAKDAKIKVKLVEFSVRTELESF